MLSKRAVPPTSSSVHLIITSALGIIVTALCCYTFYVFRTSSAREQSLTDAMKVIRAATEIVASMAERGLPGIRTRLEELEIRGRGMDQQQRKMAERLASSAPITAPTPTSSESDLLAARRAARAASANV